MSYELRRLRLHGLIERLSKTHRYRLTDEGLRTVLFLHPRVLAHPASGNGASHSRCTGHIVPDLISLRLPDDTADLPAMLARPGGPRPQALVCRGSQCLPPAANIESLLKSLS